MKKFWAVLCLLAFVVGCDSGQTLSIDGYKVKIDRSVESKSDPWIEIACSKATLNYEKRELIIEKLTSFHGNTGNTDADKSWITREMNIVNNNLIILFPKDTPFHLYLGKQYHFLPKIEKEEKKE